jgi:hypothetical protein
MMEMNLFVKKLFLINISKTFDKYMRMVYYILIITF